MGNAARYRVLLCEFCEDGTTGGSHQALVDAARLVDRERFEPVVVFYQNNRFVEPLRALGIRVHAWDRERRIEKEPHERGRRLAKIASTLGALRRRRRLLRDERIDLVHLNNTPSLGFDDWLPMARSLGLPILTSVMGSPYEFPEAPIRSALTRRFDRLMAISDHVLESLRAGGYPEALLTKVNLGIDLAAFTGRVRVPAERMRASLGIPSDRMLVVMVGNLRKWKGHSFVVSALERMQPETRRRLHVAFVGHARPEDQSHVDALRARLERAGATRDVSFLGQRTDVPDVLGAADVALHASVSHPEPFGLVLVEALSLGKPLVAPRLGGPIEILTPDAGILFDPEQPTELAAALERLLDQPELRQSMSAAARLRAQQFSAQRMADGMQRLWQELLAGGRPRSADT